MTISIQIRNASALQDYFGKYGRANQYTYAAFEALFDFYNDLDIEDLDVIGVCSEWGEYDRDGLLDAFPDEVEVDECGEVDYSILENSVVVLKVGDFGYLVSNY